MKYLGPNYFPRIINAEARKEDEMTQQHVGITRATASPEPREMCGMVVHPFAATKTRKLVQRVLPAVLIVHVHKTSSFRHIQKLCGFLRIKADLYNTQSTTDPLLYRPPNNDVSDTPTSGIVQGKYAIIVIVGLQTLVVVPSNKLNAIFNYARETSIPVILVATDGAEVKLPQLPQLANSGSTLQAVFATLSSVNFVKANQLAGSRMASMRVLPKAIVPFLAVTKSVSLPLVEHSRRDSILMSSSHHTFVPVACFEVNSTEVEEMPLILHDRGVADGVVKVLIGVDIGKFPFPLLFYDIAVGLSPVPLIKFDPLMRYIMIDIDDTFHAPTGRQPTPVHVGNIVKFQESVRQKYIKNFHLNLGFVGSGFGRGTQEEVDGAKLLIEKKDEFWWFPHTFRHVKCHSLSLEALRREMQDNRRFADAHGLSDLVGSYSVAPFHAGVYPVHLPLYQAWKEVWNITVTTTEEYPALQPSFARRGFEYEGVRVLPRQTCGIYTKHTFFSDLPPSTLQGGACGGELFQTILFNPISIFMTHYNNYGGDQLALTLFMEAFQCISKYTNLEMVQEEPQRLAELYLWWYPEEKLPIWTSPCLYQRHRYIWSENKNCSRFPSLLIVGPQKTGSTALHFFLQAHPGVRSNAATEHYEEIQFFSSRSVYKKGVDWYLDLFPYPGSVDGSSLLLFEKSATYFDSQLAAKRASALLPGAKIVAILDDPVRRAYSWYQVGATLLRA